MIFPFSFWVQDGSPGGDAGGGGGDPTSTILSVTGDFTQEAHTWHGMIDFDVAYAAIALAPGDPNDVDRVAMEADRAVSRYRFITETVHFESQNSGGTPVVEVDWEAVWDDGDETEFGNGPEVKNIPMIDSTASAEWAWVTINSLTGDTYTGGVDESITEWDSPTATVESGDWLPGASDLNWTISRELSGPVAWADFLALFVEVPPGVNTGSLATADDVTDYHYFGPVATDCFALPKYIGGYRYTAWNPQMEFQITMAGDKHFRWRLIAGLASDTVIVYAGAWHEVTIPSGDTHDIVTDAMTEFPTLWTDAGDVIQAELILRIEVEAL